MFIFKKVFTFFILLVFLTWNILGVKAIDSVDYKTYILSKSQLSETVKWRKYVNQIDNLVEQYKNNQAILEKLQNRLKTVFEKLQNDTSTKNKELKNIVNYFYFKVVLVLEEQWIEEAQEEVESIYTQTLSEEEQDLINEKLVNIQLNLFDSSTSLLEKLMEEFDELSNYEEKWDFNLDFNFSWEQLWNIEANFDMNSYVWKASNFDSQISGDIDINYISDINWKNQSLNLSTFLDFISNWGDIYLLLQDLNVSQENLDFLTNQIEKIKQVAEENKYIKYTDENSAQAMNILKSLTPKNNIIMKRYLVYSNVWSL